MIACGEDLAGQIMAHAARTGTGEIGILGTGRVSFLQLSDCCGTQAEFALAAGDFDMAVLCPDAARQFVSAGVPFTVLGGLVRNANVLVTRGTELPLRVGYMNGRELQRKAVADMLGSSATLHPIAAPALPYALECGAVDGVVLDAADAVKLRQYHVRALPCDEPSAVLVVHEALLHDAGFKRFVEHYNDTIGGLEASLRGEPILRILDAEGGEEALKAWHTMNVQLLTLPAED